MDKKKTGVIDFDHPIQSNKPASDWVDAIIRDGKSSLQIKRDEDEANA